MEAEQARLAKEKLAQTPPSELFRSQVDKFSKFDEKVLPVSHINYVVMYGLNAYCDGTLNEFCDLGFTDAR